MFFPYNDVTSIRLWNVNLEKTTVVCDQEDVLSYIVRIVDLEITTVTRTSFCFKGF